MCSYQNCQWVNLNSFSICVYNSVTWLVILTSCLLFQRRCNNEIVISFTISQALCAWLDILFQSKEAGDRSNWLRWLRFWLLFTVCGFRLSVMNLYLRKLLTMCQRSVVKYRQAAYNSLCFRKNVRKWRFRLFIIQDLCQINIILNKMPN